ncbi:MAG: hypothetical protein ACHQIG_03170 [Acidimicrobiia bacterium]
MTDEASTATGDTPGTALDTTAGTTSFEASLAAERVAERAVMRSIVRSIAIALPIGIAFFIGLIGLAAGNDLGWWVVIGIGTLLGIVAAVLFGMLGGVTLAAHAFDEVDRASSQ